MKFLFSFLSIFLIPMFCYAQIVIEERVEIKPGGNINIPNDPTSSQIITAVMEWDTTGGTHNYLRARMNMINVCTAETLLTDYIHDGYIELTMSSSDAVRFEVNTFTEGKDPPTEPVLVSFIIRAFNEDIC